MQTVSQAAPAATPAPSKRYEVFVRGHGIFMVYDLLKGREVQGHYSADDARRQAEYLERQHAQEQAKQSEAQQNDRKALADALNDARLLLLEIHRGSGRFANVDGKARDQLMARLIGDVQTRVGNVARFNSSDLDLVEFCGPLAAMRV